MKGLGRGQLGRTTAHASIVFALTGGLRGRHTVIVSSRPASADSPDVIGNDWHLRHGEESGGDRDDIVCTGEGR